MYRRLNFNTSFGQSGNSGGSENQETPKPMRSESAHRNENDYEKNIKNNHEKNHEKNHENNLEYTNNKIGHTGKKGLFGMLATDGGKSIINAVFNFIPNEIYNRDNKKILGSLTAEDLLLFSLILLVADSDDKDNIPLLAALIYILFA